MEKIEENLFKVKYRLDSSGAELAIKLLAGRFRSCKTKNITITVRGVVGERATWTENGVTTFDYNGQSMGRKMEIYELWENDANQNCDLKIKKISPSGTDDTSYPHYSGTMCLCCCWSVCVCVYLCSCGSVFRLAIFYE